MAGNSLLSDIESEITAVNAILSSTTSTQEQRDAANVRKEKLSRMQSELVDYGVTRTSANTSLQSAYTTLTDTVADLTTYTKEADLISNRLDTDIVTTKKMIDINTYYSQQYEGYKELFILITIVSTCIVFSLLLSYTPLEFLSRSLTIGICIIGGALIVYKIIYMMLVTDSNYDEYNWLISPATDNGLYSGGLLDISGTSLGNICVGPLCCGDGTQWSKKGCVLKPSDL